ncbi:MAG: Sec-independent protein translocase subunit TatA [Actinobacteria bacterium]|nr:Sec-independent protein translocase subunit TatA [Actinomycetota bacterium]MBO0837562.1 Sec-independent protein translocase subunit TatA [Actinomycetota bacterium]
MFDPSAPHIIILLIVVLLLFGAARLPRAAKSLGQSMHIFKKEVQGLNSDDKPGATNASAQVINALPAPDPAQQQLSDLQRQVADLQQQAAATSSGQAEQTEAGQTHQPL